MEFEAVPFELEVVPLEVEAPFVPVEELDVVDPLEAPVVPAFAMVAPRVLGDPLVEVRVEVDRARGDVRAVLGELDDLPVDGHLDEIGGPGGKRPGAGDVDGLDRAGRQVRRSRGAAVDRDLDVGVGAAGDAVLDRDARGRGDRLLRLLFAALPFFSGLGRVVEARDGDRGHVLLVLAVLGAEHQHQDHDEEHEDDDAGDDERQPRLHRAVSLRPGVEVGVLGTRKRRVVGSDGCARFGGSASREPGRRSPRA